MQRVIGTNFRDVALRHSYLIEVTWWRTDCKIASFWPDRDRNIRPPALEINKLTLDQKSSAFLKQ